MSSQNNFEKQFCNYDISKALKELGFNEDCLGCFDPEIGRLVLGDLEDYFNYNIPENLVYAPLYQQVIDWFREKHNIHIVIEDHTFVDVINDGSGYKYYIDVYGCTEVGRSEFINTYYEAREQAILKAIELIKEK